jgi:hypothetical protein
MGTVYHVPLYKITNVINTKSKVTQRQSMINTIPKNNMDAHVATGSEEYPNAIAEPIELRMPAFVARAEATTLVMDEKTDSALEATD